MPSLCCAHLVVKDLRREELDRLTKGDSQHIKKAVRVVNRFCTALVQDPDFNPPNMDWVRDYTWRCMDNACNTLDWVAMQKVIKAEEARDIKERMVEKVAR